MLRSLLFAPKAFQCLGTLAASLLNKPVQPVSSSFVQNVSRGFCVNTTSGTYSCPTPYNITSNTGLLQPKQVLTESVRNVIKFSRSGKRTTVKIVLRRFFRLHWGMWIHTRCGRHKKMYRKSAHQKRRLSYHVMCNGRQNYLLDRMVTRYWRKPRYYVDDIYEPYHTREEYKYARMKPYNPFQ